jgi:hypothetical protein
MLGIGCASSTSDMKEFRNQLRDIISHLPGTPETVRPTSSVSDALGAVLDSMLGDLKTHLEKWYPEAFQRAV